MVLNDKRIRIIVGHFGSGKSEFSINYAVKLSQVKKKVVLADLDIVNLYFRSREKEEELKKLGIKVIGSSIKGLAADLPAISSEIYGPIQDESCDLVIDVGGDPNGARVLGMYSNYFTKDNYDMFFVLNGNRPETQTVKKSIEYLRKIENTARIQVTGIVNNTHMLKSTTYKDVLKGQALAEKLSQELNIPIRYISVIENVVKDLPDNLEGEIFPIKLYLREEWMV